MVLNKDNQGLWHYSIVWYLNGDKFRKQITMRLTGALLACKVETHKPQSITETFHKRKPLAHTAEQCGARSIVHDKPCIVGHCSPLFPIVAIVLGHAIGASNTRDMCAEWPRVPREKLPMTNTASFWRFLSPSSHSKGVCSSNSFPIPNYSNQETTHLP